MYEQPDRDSADHTVREGGPNRVSMDVSIGMMDTCGAAAAAVADAAVNAEGWETRITLLPLPPPFLLLRCCGFHMGSGGSSGGGSLLLPENAKNGHGISRL